MNKTVWIIGASSGLGREVAEQYAALGHEVILSSRNLRDLNDLGSHIAFKFGVRTHSIAFDVGAIDAASKANEIIQQLTLTSAYPDVCYFLSGTISDEDESLNAVEVLDKLLKINFTGPVFLLNEVIRNRTNKSIEIVVASSVAAIRARGRNISYGTAKLALENYCFGLMHALVALPVIIRIYRFGYMDTNLSFGQKLPFPPAPVSTIAKQLIHHTGKAPGLYYLPKFWQLIGLVLKMIPFQLYKKLKF